MEDTGDRGPGSSASSVSLRDNNLETDDNESVFSLCLDPQDWQDDEDDWDVFDACDIEDEAVTICPGCKQTYKGKTDKGKNAWLSRHIRLHNVQNRRENLCSVEEVVSEGPQLAKKVLHEIKDVDNDNWTDSKSIARILLSRNCDDLLQYVCQELAPLLHEVGSLFFREEHKMALMKFQQLVVNATFRSECLRRIFEHVTEDKRQFAPRFLSSFLIRMKDSLFLFRISRIKQRLPPPQLLQSEKRGSLVLYVGGWMIHQMKLKYWRRIKVTSNSLRLTYIKDHFEEGGQFAQKVTDRKVRYWVDAKNRSTNGKNGLSIPSLGCFSFLEQLDKIIQQYEGKTCLTGILSKEQVFRDVYNDVELLDLWTNITPEMDGDAQQAFLESTVENYRKFDGHANAKRLQRGLRKRKLVPIRTDLKRNSSASSKKQKKS